MPDGPSTAEMPFAPDYSGQEQKSPMGSAYILHQYLAETDERAFILQYQTFPNDVDVSNPRTNLQGGVDSADNAKNLLGGKWTTVEWSIFQGLPAVATIGTHTSGFDLRTFSVVRGRQLFVLVYVGPKGTAGDADAQRYLASLKLR